MKKFNTLLIIPIMLVFIITTSCGNNAEVEKLKAELQSLKTENESLKGKASINGAAMVFDSLAQAARATLLFQTKQSGDKLVIPVSWRFDKADFKNEICDTEVAYFRFYPSLNENIVGDSLRLIMVPVDSKGNDLVGTEGDPRVYNFTLNCPSV